MSQRKLLPGVKDANGAYYRPEDITPPATPNPPETGISIDDLIDKHHLILYRETVRLLENSVIGKLSKDDAQCVRDNLKLLLELKKREREYLDSLTEDDIKKLADK